MLTELTVELININPSILIGNMDAYYAGTEKQLTTNDSPMGSHRCPGSISNGNQQ